MRCLGIESSCDETALAIIEDGKLIGDVIASQADTHALFGGVVPELASREHGRLIGSLFDILCKKSGIPVASIDVFAFCRGPGLLGSLLIGAGFAKALALGQDKPVIGINHLHAHLLAAGIEHTLDFPSLGLLISGGHTHIYRINSPVDFTLLGRTLDDAAGEAFDKIGKSLGLSYPAGRLIAKLAGQGKVDKRLFRPPYIDNDNMDFSFSGIKTSAAKVIAANPELRLANWDEHFSAPENSANFCATLTYAIAQTLCIKIRRALDRQKDVRAIIVAGGVAANTTIRASMKEIAESYSLPLQIPSPALCTDNGSMIAYLGWLLSNAGFTHPLHVSCIPRGTPVPNDFLY